MIKLNTISIDAIILNLIAELDEFKGRWEMLGRLAADTLQSLRKVATIESVGSSTRIEGARLSDHQIEALLANLDVNLFRSCDEKEVAGYAEAMGSQIELYTQGLDAEGFRQNRLVQDAVIRQFEIIGETSKNISTTMRFQYSDIPWKDLAGFRDKLIHRYFGVDIVSVWLSVTTDLPILKQQIAALIANQ